MAKVTAERVCPCADAAAGRVYPVERPAGGRDDRFGPEVVREVGEVLTAAGFPAVEDDSPDHYALMWCLWRFVYGYAARGRHGADAAPGGPGGGRGE
ncbi:hypothetical protein [Actinomadura hibisca]|uniref:hypothetical protein n=1 Tax=Actinomadura hibisca TaxID=68565 RepID=UPI000831399F|nr:hypothetical protein [Actinomadura hibisca]